MKDIEMNIENNKYKPYKDWSEDYLAQLLKETNNSQWRQNFHVQPESGLLNDPNGFSYFNGEWNIFYQAFPFGTIHGLKSWYKATSKDLVNWEPKGEAILPDTEFDSHGAYSGSALSIGTELRIFYTGNVRDRNWQRMSYQLGAAIDLNGNIRKFDYPLIDQIPEGYTAHFRDPQVFSYDGKYYLIIGAQTVNLEGKILIYISKNLTDWELKSELYFTDKKMGYMIECPHLVGITESPILLFCPQGLSQDILHYKNINPNCYCIANNIDLKNGIFDTASKIENLDDGFDIYATQAIDSSDGRTLAVSWLGLPETEYPVVEDGWTNCLSLIKQLKVVDNQLYQFPVEEIRNYRKLFSATDGFINGKEVLHKPERNCYEYEIVLKNKSIGKILLLSDDSTQNYFEIQFNTSTGIVKIDRSKVSNRIEETDGYRITRVTPENDIKMNIFVDSSSIEIFFNDGIKVSSTLVFPNKYETTICIEGAEVNYSDKLFLLEI